MNLGHPILQDMIKLGCKNQNKIFLAFNSYMELCEVHKAQDVNYYYNNELDLIYLSATIGKENLIYIPVSGSSSISPSWITKFRGSLPKTSEVKAIHIMLFDTDTTSVIYRITDGLERPLSPNTAKHNKEQKEKKGLIGIEIKNLLPTLILEARKRDPSNDTT